MHITLLKKTEASCGSKIQLKGVPIRDLKTHKQFGESFTETVRKVSGIFGREIAPNQSTPKRVRFKRFLEKMSDVSESVAENPGTLIRHISQHLDISRNSL